MLAFVTASGDPDRDGQLRPEEVRHAFNSPFWPHVLITTSVGQEGLDFHPGAERWRIGIRLPVLWRWNSAKAVSPGTPVFQSEGHWRDCLQPADGGRRKSLGVVGTPRRGRICRCDGAAVVDRARASVQRMLFSVPGSDVIEERMAALSHERAIYRIALGMPGSGRSDWSAHE